MKHFTVYMEFYGKKIKTTVKAENAFRADMEVRKRLHILKITEEKIEDDFLDVFKDMFGMK